MKHPHLADSQRRTLAAYGDLVVRYHATLDLVSSAALADWDAHLAGALDYAAVLTDTVPPSGHLLDLGSGAGLPGIVIATALPGRRVHLVERRRRRAAFLTMAVGALGLDNTVVHGSDAADLERTDLSPTGVLAVTAQAVAPFDVVYRVTRHLHADPIALVSRKNDDWNAEIERLQRACSVRADVRSMPTRPRGTLVAIDVPGGRACPSSE